MYRDTINRLLSDYRSLSTQVNNETLALIDAEDQESFALDAQKILKETAQEVQQAVHSRIADVVTRCLRTVFDDPYEFKINFEQKRGRTEANLVFERRGIELTDPVNSVGGGVLDVAAFALRVSCLVLEKPARRRLLVLDEPFSRVRGENNRRRMRDLVEMLADDFGMQLILCIDVNAYPEFLMSHVIELG